MYIQAVLDQLRKVGYPVKDDDVKHLAPLMREHINPYGGPDIKTGETPASSEHGHDSRENV